MTKENQIPLHPAAGVFRDQLLVEIGQENKKLEENTSRLSEACDFLGCVELRLGTGRVVSATLQQSFIVNNFNGFLCLCIPVAPVDILLSDFRSGSVSASGQNIGNFPGVADPILKIDGDDGSGKVSLKLLFSSYNIIEGELRGLSQRNVRDEQVMNYLVTGHGLENPNALTFIPSTIYMIIIPEFRDTIRALGPLPKFGSLNKLHECLPVDTSDFFNCPPPSSSDESRLSTLSALDCTDSQLELLEQNRNLKALKYRLSMIEERIGMVEIHHTKKNTAFLTNGVLRENLEGSPVWQVPLRRHNQYDVDCSIAVNDISSLRIVVSGIKSEPVRMEVYGALDGIGMTYFSGSFKNGATLFGIFDPESAPEMNMHDFREMARGISSGERLFPPTYAIVATHIYFPLSSIQNTLNVLRVDSCSG